MLKKIKDKKLQKKWQKFLDSFQGEIAPLQTPFQDLAKYKEHSEKFLAAIQKDPEIAKAALIVSGTFVECKKSKENPNGIKIAKKFDNN
jgi:hypothetical protein